MSEMNQTPRSRIFEACKKIQAHGQKVTNASVLEIVGGSMSTVNRYVREWHKIAPVSSNLSEIPPEMLHALNEWFGGVKSHAEDRADQVIQEVGARISRLESDLRQRDRELEDSEARNVELAEEVRELKVELSKANEDLATLNETVNSQKAAAMQMKDEFSAARRELLERIEEERTRATREVDRVEETYKASESRMAEMLDRERQSARQEKQQLNAELEKMRSRTDEIKDELQQAVSDRAELAAEKKTLLERTRIAEAAKTAAEQQLSEVNAGLAKAQGRMEVLETELEKQRKQASSLLEGLQKKSPKPRGKAPAARK